MRTRFLPLLAALVLLSACTSGGPTSTTPAPGTPTPAPGTPTPAGEFSLLVVPPEEPVEARVAIPGERICFLVVIEEQDGGGGPVTVTASASGASVIDVRSASLEPGTVGEVWVVPDASSVETTATVDITANRGGVDRTEHRSISIMPMADERAADAQPYFERWVAWLAANQPQLGITLDTVWQPTFVSTFLVVSHYAYWSAEWEMVVAWHNMIPPSDWSEIYLRHRDTEAQPSLAFRIDSVAGNTEPQPVGPPAEVMR
jgi:hypothetical protein